jgi:hypothetical protein
VKEHFVCSTSKTFFNMHVKYILILAAINRVALSIPIEPEPPAPACAGTPENCNKELAKPDVPCEGTPEVCGQKPAEAIPAPNQETIPVVVPDEAQGCGGPAIPLEDVPIADGEILLLSLSIPELEEQIKKQPEVFGKTAPPVQGSNLPLIIMPSTKENLQAIGINMTKAQIKEDEQKNPDAYMWGPPIAIELAEAAKTLTFQLDIYRTVDAAPAPTPVQPGGNPAPAEVSAAVMPPAGGKQPDELETLMNQYDALAEKIMALQDKQTEEDQAKAMELLNNAAKAQGNPPPATAPAPGKEGDKKTVVDENPVPKGDGDGKPKEGEPASASSQPPAPTPTPTPAPAPAGQPQPAPAVKARGSEGHLLGRDGAHAHHAPPVIKARGTPAQPAVRARGLNDKLLGRAGHVHHASGRKA